MKAFAGKHFLLVVENNSAPFDRRVWREALALRDEGARVSIISPRDAAENRSRARIEGIEIYRYRTKFSEGSTKDYLSEYLGAFIKTLWLFHIIWLSRGRVHILHVANPPDIFWPLAIYGKFMGVKFIFDEHDLSPETYLSRIKGHTGRSGLFFGLLMIFQYLSYRFADAVISTNETYRRVALTRYSGNELKTFVVRNGPDTRRFLPTSPDPSLKRGRSILLGYLGIMAIQDGVEYIIRAAQYLINDKGFDDFIIYLIGAGSDVRRLKQLTSQCGLESHVLFTGRLDDGPTLQILSTADICLSPDPSNPLNDCSTMNKVMEYMCLGKPLVSFSLHEARVSAGDAALYAANNDVPAFAEAILDLIHDSEKRQKMGDYGRRRIEESLSWQKQIEHLLKAYRHVAS